MSSEGRFKALRGMKDVYPPDIHLWTLIEDTAKDIFRVFGFQEMRTPVLESTEVFVRSIGEETDIVDKEMYTFLDKGERSVTLRPEGTASIVRAYVENNIYAEPSPQKFFYSGPMFRFERPQAGRLRQFYQIGAEAFGSASPMMETEILSAIRLLFERLGLRELSFQINSIGCRVCRPAFKDALLAFFNDLIPDMCEDCRRRFGSNPLRILDCKAKVCTSLRKEAPKVTEYLCSNCEAHFNELRSLLDRIGIHYQLNPEMVRGLDYYTGSTFEVTSADLGAQNAVAAGGRYDGLVAAFGGPETPAVGFALGMERLVELLKGMSMTKTIVPKVFLALLGREAAVEGLAISEVLRRNGLWVEMGISGSSLKSQMRRADRMFAEYVVIVGDDELAREKVKWKRLADAAQGEIAFGEIQSFFLGR